MVLFAYKPLAPVMAAKIDRHSHPLAPLSASPHLFRVGGNRPVASFCSTLQSPPSPTAASYDDALSRLSSLISRRVRGDGANRRDHFELMSQYLQILELDGPISRLKVIHIAGTKGKGSTCSFTESIMRNCGFRTGLFTSPHLIDVRERFRLEGAEISVDKFLKYFWWCWNRLQEKTDDKVPMPAYFRFLALLAFKIFTEEQVDVAILEVGLGGKFDATNVVKAPIVCGISSLGYDHMEILGNTLAEIAGEKAGIFKENVPTYTVPQTEDAMKVLDYKAFQLGIPLLVAPPLDVRLLNGQKLGLDGEHQYLNAGLAISLCHSWLKATGHSKIKDLDDDSVLPENFIRGLATTMFPGRAQVAQDPHVCVENFRDGGLIFYLDGAHSPESMETCAKWFSNVLKKDAHQLYSTQDQIGKSGYVKNILLFNCMSVRDPKLLLSRLLKVCADHGVFFNKAIFVPNQSVYNKVGSFASDANDSQVDLSWQQTLQRVWQNLVYGGKGSSTKRSTDNMIIDFNHERKKDANERNIICQGSSSIFCSLPSAIKWIRNAAQQNQTVRFQVLVTGSLHLVGDVLRLIKK